MPDVPTAIALLNQSINEYVLPPKLNLEAKFRAWHVEALLNQASDLLDRCMSERRELQALAARRAENSLKLATMISEANFLKSRFDNGWYAVSLDSYMKSQVDLSNWQTTLDQARVEAYRLQNEAPGPTYSKNVVERSAMAAWQKANIEIIERNNRAAADKSDLIVLKKSIDSATMNAEAATAAHAAPDGPLYFDEQIQSLQGRIIDDFKDAYERLKVASFGLDLFYGYAEPLPTSADVKAVGVDELSLLDTVSLWARAAIRWMVATLQYEQVFSLPISIRAMVPSDVWKATLDTLKSNGKAKFSFRLDVSSLPGYRYVRFRGVSGFSPGSPDVWSANLWLPRTAVSVQKRRGEEERTRDDVDQTQLPSCVLGRIVAREFPREPELAGVNSLRNASPFGKKGGSDGEILVEVSWPFGKPPTDVTMPSDFQFEFLLAAIPKST